MKKGTVFISLFLCFTLLFCLISPVISKSETISHKVFRLHILANSDSTADQALKLQVRDAVLKETAAFYTQCNSAEEAADATCAHLNQIRQMAEKTVIDAGYAYPVQAVVTRAYFNTRIYDTFTLPAGVYPCLKIEIGESRGHNWWCVMFPTVCLSGCMEDFDAVLTQEEKEMITGGNYRMRFKVVEIYERWKAKQNK